MHSTVLYETVKNSLTVPPSYYPRVSVRTIFSQEGISTLINEKNPGVPIETVKTVLDTLRIVVVEQTSSGNTIKLENFISLRPALSGKMDNATDPLPNDPFSVQATVAAPFQTEVKNAATFEKLGIADKTPSVASARDTNLSILNLVREGKGFEINGAQMEWNQAASDEGAFLVSSNATTRQTNVSYNKATKAFIVPELDAGISSPNVEYRLDIRTRYTENGQLKTGSYGDRLRTTNVISDATTDQVCAVGAAAGPATLDYVGLQVDARLEVTIGTDGITRAQIGTIEGVFGPPVQIMANGAYVLTGLAADVTLNVTDYDTLNSNVFSYGKYMQEVLDLSPLTP